MLRTEEERRYYTTNANLYESSLATFYDLVALPLHWLRRRVARVANVSGRRVLDVATGTGSQARAFARAGGHVVGIDLSPRMLATARRKNRRFDAQFVEGDATELPMADETFDVASISLALHEMPPPVRARAVHELARVTRRGGAVVIVEPVQPRNRVWRALVVNVLRRFEPEPYREFLRADLGELLSRSGIAVRSEHRAVFDTLRVVEGVRR